MAKRGRKPTAAVNTDIIPQAVTDFLAQGTQSPEADVGTEMSRTLEAEDDLRAAKTKEERLARIEELMGTMRSGNGGKLATARGKYGAKEEVLGVLHTGSIGLDAALGVGGFPRGRIVEVFGEESSGKTTLALQTIAQVQKEGGIAAFIDAEHALDITYAAKLGVDLDTMILEQPDSGEQALELARGMARSGKFDLIVVDSVAALVPQSELNGEIGDSQPGAQARLMSQALRMSGGAVRSGNCVLLFLNQMRDKIGVKFGCFQYGSRVRLADGSSERIGKLVNQKRPAEVLSFDPETGKVSARRITNWFDNGNAPYFLQVTTESVGGRGSNSLGVTSGHLISTPSGFKTAEDLRVGDEVLAAGPVLLSPIQRQIALGSVLGDGSLRLTGRHSVQLRVAHGENQVDYARWKASRFNDLVAYAGTNNSNEAWGFDLAPSVDLLEIQKEAYTEGHKGKGKRRMSQTLLRELDLPAVAIWYMDDGSFSGSYEYWGHGKSTISMKSYTIEDIHLLADRLAELGLPRPAVSERYLRLYWSGKQNETFQEAIAKYVHPSMGYKMHPNLRDKYEEWGDEAVEPTYKMIPVKVTDIYVKPPTRSMRKFDIEVEGNHTYLVDGVGVHNSPRTTSGGKALKFYASVRIEVTRIGALKMNDTVFGNRVRFKVVKLKVAPPFRVAEVDMIFGQGISRLGELLDYGLSLGLVIKSGAWYALSSKVDPTGPRLGQGKENSIRALGENKPWERALYSLVMQSVELPSMPSTETDE